MDFLQYKGGSTTGSKKGKEPAGVHGAILIRNLPRG